MLRTLTALTEGDIHRAAKRRDVDVSVSTLRKVYEGYLLRCGLVWMTPFGRVAA